MNTPLLKFFTDLSQRRAQVVSGQYTAFAIFGIFNYPIYYFIWLYVSPQTYENFWLRLTATILCIVLLLHKVWPLKLKPYLPLYWYLTILYCLPFFFTYMLLRNHGAETWITNTIVVVLISMILIDWLTCLALLAVGSSLAIISALLSGAWPFFHPSFDYQQFFINYTVEFYLTDASGTFLLLDAKGNASWLIMKDEEDMEALADQAKHADTPPSNGIADAIENRTKLVHAHSEDEMMLEPHQWESLIHPATELAGRKGKFYYAVVDDANAYDINKDNIQALDD